MLLSYGYFLVEDSSCKLLRFFAGIDYLGKFCHSNVNLEAMYCLIRSILKTCFFGDLI